LYGGAKFRDRHVTSRSNRSFSIPTALALLVVACALAGCGRKAGLDPPPGTAEPTSVQGQAGAAPSEPAAVPRDSFDPLSTRDTSPRAAKGERKRIPLDAILD
jgi:predicted small lipoprotein YifL